MADEQLCADLGVGETILGESVDLCFLWCEQDACVICAPEQSLARSQELAASAFGERLGAHATESVVCDPQLLTRIHPAARAAQPFA
jgi:hypothetical protein